MAKSKSIKSLKTRTTRAAKPARPRGPGDTVSVLLAQQRRLLHAMSVVEKKGRECKASDDERGTEWYGGVERAAWDRMSHALNELSYTRPTTQPGAVFTLVAAYAGLTNLDAIQDHNFRERHRRRGVRLLYSLLHYLTGGDRLGINPGDDYDHTLNRVARYYMPPWDDPHFNLEDAHSFAVAGNDESDGAAS